MTVAVSLLLGFGGALGDEVRMKVRIDRQYPANACTSGYLSVNGKQIVYTLERPWVGNINNISRIPAGTYAAHLRYDKKDHWRIELEKVPGRTGVQIHIGNEPEQSTGCILVGSKLTADLCHLERSADAYRALKRAFYGTDAPAGFDPRDIEVTISGPSSTASVLTTTGQERRCQGIVLGPPATMAARAAR